MDEEPRSGEDWNPDEFRWDPRRLVAHPRDAAAEGEEQQDDEGGEPMEQEAAAQPDSGGAEVCMVKDCNTDLSGCKAYYRRFRICERHLKQLSLVIEGKPSRFCQQCGRFHVLEEFEGNKRSCRRALLTRFYKRRKMPVPPEAMLPPAVDSVPRGAGKDTDPRGAKSPASGAHRDPSQPPPRRKRGRPRAPPMDVRDLTPDEDPQVKDEPRVGQGLEGNPGPHADLFAAAAAAAFPLQLQQQLLVQQPQQALQGPQQQQLLAPWGAGYARSEGDGGGGSSQGPSGSPSSGDGDGGGSCGDVRNVAPYLRHRAAYPVMPVDVACLQGMGAAAAAGGPADVYRSGFAEGRDAVDVGLGLRLPYGSQGLQGQERGQLQQQGLLEAGGGGGFATAAAVPMSTREAAAAALGLDPRQLGLGPLQGPHGRIQPLELAGAQLQPHPKPPSRPTPLQHELQEQQLLLPGIARMGRLASAPVAAGGGGASAAGGSEGLSRLERHVQLLRQPSEMQSVATAGNAGLTTYPSGAASGPSGGGSSSAGAAAAVSGLQPSEGLQLSAWWRGGSVLAALGSNAVGRAGGGIGGGKEAWHTAAGAGGGTAAGSTDPLEAELLSIASESLMDTGQAIQGHGTSLVDRARSLLGLPPRPQHHPLPPPPQPGQAPQQQRRQAQQPHPQQQFELMHQQQPQPQLGQQPYHEPYTLILRRLPQEEQELQFQQEQALFEGPPAVQPPGFYQEPSNSGGSAGSSGGGGSDGVTATVNLSGMVGGYGHERPGRGRAFNAGVGAGFGLQVGAAAGSGFQGAAAGGGPGAGGLGPVEPSRMGRASNVPYPSLLDLYRQSGGGGAYGAFEAAGGGNAGRGNSGTGSGEERSPGPGAGGLEVLGGGGAGGGGAGLLGRELALPLPQFLSVGSSTADATVAGMPVPALPPTAPGHPPHVQAAAPQQQYQYGGPRFGPQAAPDVQSGGAGTAFGGYQGTHSDDPRAILEAELQRAVAAGGGVSGSYVDMPPGAQQQPHQELYGLVRSTENPSDMGGGRLYQPHLQSHQPPQELTQPPPQLPAYYQPVVQQPQSQPQPRRPQPQEQPELYRSVAAPLHRPAAVQQRLQDQPQQPRPMQEPYPQQQHEYMQHPQAPVMPPPGAAAAMAALGPGEPSLRGPAQRLLAHGGPRAAYAPPSTLLERLSLKVHGCRPEQLPNDLADRLLGFLASTDASVVQGFVRPGCTQLLLDLLYSDRRRLVSALLGGGGSSAADPRVAAERLARGLLARPDGWEPWSRLHLQLGDALLTLHDGEARLRHRAALLPPGVGSSGAATQSSAYSRAGGDGWTGPEVTGVAPVAVVAGCDMVLELLCRGALPSGTSFHVRFRGMHLDVLRETGSDSESSDGSEQSDPGSPPRSGSHGLRPAAAPPPPPRSTAAAPQPQAAEPVAAAAAGNPAPSGAVSRGEAGSVGDPPLRFRVSGARGSQGYLESEPYGVRTVHEPVLRHNVSAAALASNSAVTPDAGAVAPIQATQAAQGQGQDSGQGTTRLGRSWLPLTLRRAARGGISGGAAVPAESSSLERERNREWGSNEQLPCRLSSALTAPSSAATSASAAAAIPADAPAPGQGQAPDVSDIGTDRGTATAAVRRGPLAQAVAVGLLLSSIDANADSSTHSSGEWADARSRSLPLDDCVAALGDGPDTADMPRGEEPDIPTVATVAELRWPRQDAVYAGSAPPALSRTLEGPPPPPPVDFRRRSEGSRAQATTSVNALAAATTAPRAPPPPPLLLSTTAGSGQPTRSVWSLPQHAAASINTTSAETYVASDVTDVGDGDDGDAWGLRSSGEISPSSSSHLYSPGYTELDVVVLFVQPAPRAGLAIVEAESPPTSVSASAQGSGGGGGGAYPRTSHGGFAVRGAGPGRSSVGAERGGGGGWTGAASALPIGGVLSEWWPVVVVPAAAAAAATELNSLLEEDGDATWLRPLLVDMGLVVEALDPDSSQGPYVDLRSRPQGAYHAAAGSAPAAGAASGIIPSPGYPDEVFGSTVVHEVRTHVATGTGDASNRSSSADALPLSPASTGVIHYRTGGYGRFVGGRSAFVSDGAVTGAAAGESQSHALSEPYSAGGRVLSAAGRMVAATEAYRDALFEGEGGGGGTSATAAFSRAELPSAAEMAAAAPPPPQRPLGYTCKHYGEAAAATAPPTATHLIDLTSAEAASFFGLGQSANADAGPNSSGSRGPDSALRLPAHATVQPVLLPAPSPSPAPLRLATTAAAAPAGDAGPETLPFVSHGGSVVPQIRQPEQDPHGRQLEQGQHPAAQGAGARPAASEAWTPHGVEGEQALQEAGIRRTLDAAAVWRTEQQRQLAPRGRALLVFFCNRGFRHCAAVVLACLLRAAGVEPAIADAVSGVAPPEAAEPTSTETTGTAAAVSASAAPGPAALQAACAAFAVLATAVRIECGGLGLLHHAVRSGSAQTVRWLLRAGQLAGAPLDVMEPGPHGVTPLHLAAMLPGGGGAVLGALVEHATGVTAAAAAAMGCERGLAQPPADAAAPPPPQRPLQTGGSAEARSGSGLEPPYRVAGGGDGGNGGGGPPTGAGGAVVESGKRADGGRSSLQSVMIARESACSTSSAGNSNGSSGSNSGTAVSGGSAGCLSENSSPATPFMPFIPPSTATTAVGTEGETVPPGQPAAAAPPMGGAAAAVEPAAPVTTTPAGGGDRTRWAAAGLALAAAAVVAASGLLPALLLLAAALFATLLSRRVSF